MKSPVPILALISAKFLCVLSMSPPIPRNPARPTPYFSWDTVPIAFHGANTERAYTSDESKQLARYQMVTIEKWYTACGSQGPKQAGPECDVEAKMAATFKAVKAANPHVTTLMYLNSMFNFAAYHLNGLLLDQERAGRRSLLRDRNGTLVSLCNDGNVYCNITTYDLSVPTVRDLWLQTVLNMTRVGGVDGVFADHGFEQGIQPSMHDLGPPDDPVLCNGQGASRACYHFDPKFAAQFNYGHEFLLNNTQDVVAKLTGGVVIDGPYGSWNRPICNLREMQKVVAAGQAGTGPFVLEFNRGLAHGTGDAGCHPDENCLAAFLIAAERYSYMACFPKYSGNQSLPHFPKEFSRPLGAPTNPAVENPEGMWTRRFVSHLGETLVTYDEANKKGKVSWAGGEDANLAFHV